MGGADWLKVELLVVHPPPVRVGDRDCRRRMARTSMRSRKICPAVLAAGFQRVKFKLSGANDERREISEGKVDRRPGAPLRAKR